MYFDERDRMVVHLTIRQANLAARSFDAGSSVGSDAWPAHAVRLDPR
ncbi:hypothetical protein [Pararobbsia alpina]|uniref:Uncharacterized protein n=1 Tax=Pararobbsia alpina TaxID=621374 RepID=A0A6S7B2J8_9BURK|nr:hypothetical protein [Pararobbsia alpina]CAB3778956.1 hypothetical protein LMG28138_00715 [Pararobbsia alpina]